MPRYFLPWNRCFQVISHRSKRWKEIGKQVEVLNSGKYSPVFADGVQQAYVPESVEQVVMPMAAPALHVVARLTRSTSP